MIVVRNVFQARYGRGDDVAARLREGARAAGAAYGGRWRVLTDRSGPFFTVVIEFEAESLAHWAGVRARHFEDPAIAAALVATQPWITGGTLELYTVEAEG